MIDHRMIRDLAIALSLAVPTIALARPQAIHTDAAAAQPLVKQVALADRTGAERRFAL